ncbi:MAG: O-antigen ligase family protein [Nitrospirae bacterium]|nr:O-antigen ligase family protein [Nitrospirota bacterium]
MAIAMFIMVAKLNHIIEYFFVGLLILWVGVKVRNRDFHLVRTPLDLPIFFFLAWILITIHFAVDPSYSFGEWRKTVLQILMFYFVVNVVKKEKYVRQIIFAFLLGVFLWSGVGIVDHLVRGDSLFDRSSHAYSLTASGQWFSTYLVVGVPFAWLLFRESEGRLAKLYLSISFVIIFALLLAHQRGAWLAFFAQLTGLWLICVRNKFLKWSIVPFIFGLILIGGFWIQENQKSVVQHNHLANLGSINLRLGVWQIAFEQILANPIMGYGYGNHTFQKNNEKRTDGSGNDISEQHLHNVLLSMVYEVGLIGFALFALVIFRIIKTAYHGAKKLRGTFAGNLGLCVILLVIGVVTRNLFDNMLVGTLSYLFWLLIGMYFAIHVSSQRDGFEEKIILGRL